MTTTMKTDMTTPMTKLTMQEELARIWREEGVTMILVTHEMKFAREVASHVIYLYNGQIEEEGPPDILFGSPKSERLKQFLKTVG